MRAHATPRLTGSLAGLASLVAGHPAYAGVATSSVANVDLDLSGSAVNVDIDSNGENDFRFFGFYGDTQMAAVQPLGGEFQQTYIAAPFYYAVVGSTPGSTVNASVLNRSNTGLLSYGGVLQLGPGTVYVVGSLRVTLVPPGYMTPGVYEYHLAWLKFDLTNGNFAFPGQNTLVSAAWETTPIGQPGGDEIFVPEPGGVDAMALGALGVLALRRARRRRPRADAG